MSDTDYVPLYDHALNEDELRRNLLWKQQRMQRVAYRARVQNSLAGNAQRSALLRSKFQPWLDYAVDINAPDLGDDPETIPVSNQELNSS